VDFFGAPAHFPPGPAAVALRAKVPLLVAGVYAERFDDGQRGWTADISEPIELPEGLPVDEAIEVLTDQVAKKLEDFVARRPEEWHVFQPFWIEDMQKDPA
jgi:lauroyl/myristoyl acyltransferase